MFGAVFCSSVPVMRVFATSLHTVACKCGSHFHHTCMNQLGTAGRLASCKVPMAFDSSGCCLIVGCFLGVLLCIHGNRQQH
jgi:hypothetical protein